MRWRSQLGHRITGSADVLREDVVYFIFGQTGGEIRMDLDALSDDCKSKLNYYVDRASSVTYLIEIMLFYRAEQALEPFERIV